MNILISLFCTVTFSIFGFCHATPNFGNTLLSVPQGGTGASSFSGNTIVGINAGHSAFVATGTPELTAGFYNATSTTATSTFSAGIQATYLNLTGNLSTSTFANGVKLTSGCFLLPSGTCAGTGGGGTPAGSNLQVQYNNGGAFGASPDLLWDNTNKILSIATSSGSSSSIIAGVEAQTFNINGSNAVTSGSGGAGITLLGGTASTSGIGGAINIIAGTGSPNVVNGTGIGGSLTLKSGDAGLAGGNAGDLSLFSGDAKGGNTNGGNIIFSAGDKSGAGNIGTFWFYASSSADWAGKLDLSSIVGSDKTFTFPNYSGKFVLNVGTTPILGTCGTATITATSTDTRGDIVVTGGTPTTCNLTFSSAKADTPACVTSTNSISLFSDVALASTTGVKFGLSAVFSGRITYICVQ